MGLEMDLLDGALFSQTQAKQDPNSLAAKIVGMSVPWAKEASQRQGREQATDALAQEAKARENSAKRAKTREVDDELLRRDPEHYSSLSDSRHKLEWFPVIQDANYGKYLRPDETPEQRQFIHEALTKYAQSQSADRVRRYHILHNLP